MMYVNIYNKAPQVADNVYAENIRKKIASLTLRMAMSLG